jgi:hypothetical protein
MRCHCDTQPCTSSDFIAPVLRLDFLAEVPFNRCIRAAAGVVGEIPSPLLAPIHRSQPRQLIDQRSACQECVGCVRVCMRLADLGDISAQLEGNISASSHLLASGQLARSVSAFLATFKSSRGRILPVNDRPLSPASNRNHSGPYITHLFWALRCLFQTMPFISSKLNFLPPFVGRESLYSSIEPHLSGGIYTIRILTVLPSHDVLAPIEATLRIALYPFRDIEGDYTAVSYYWGDINAIEYLTVRGSDEGVPGLVCQLPVTKNLVAALRQFRARASVSKEPLQLWIDAVCINQTDAVERARQVGLME